MDNSLGLNDRQYDAVHTIQGPLLIIAGAGSGKTRVITFRIAHMLESHIPQNAILALTFTNKAAREMEQRVKELTGKKLSNLTVSTFHAFGVQILREHGESLGFRPNFSIYDSNDSLSLLKECARELNQAWEPQELMDILNEFSAVKTRRRTLTGEFALQKKLYDEYQEHLKLYNAVDFDDLIMKPIELFESHPDVLEQYQKRYKYIMVDEFQDTSISQYEMVRWIAKTNRNICVVGDDDQSIYSWRGANYENLLLFEKDFNELKEIKLEQNYRSTGTILAAANAVIANNTNRKVKELWTGSDGGRAIELSFPEDETQEGFFVARTIKTLMVKENLKYEDVGILVRTNNLTKNIELALMAENVPYKVSGGSSFFQRKEVKDIVAYLRLVTNPQDDVNFLRIINTPRRGIGRTSLEQIVRLSQLKKCSLYEAVSDLVLTEQNPLPLQTLAELQEFVELIRDYKIRFSKPKIKIAPQVRELVETLDYWGYLLIDNPKSDKAARWKYQNVESLIQFMDEWENDADNSNPTLLGFLNRIALVTRDKKDSTDDRGAVNLMTVHAAKGLEFNVVFLVGVEENIMPHAKSLEEGPEVLEEERRLFYVAITRARKKLYMTACKTRRTMKDTFHPALSPFVDEIPQELLTHSIMDEELDENSADDIFESLKMNFT